MGTAVPSTSLESALANRVGPEPWQGCPPHSEGLENCRQEEFSEPIGMTPSWGLPDAIEDTNSPAQCVLAHLYISILIWFKGEDVLDRKT